MPGSCGVRPEGRPGPAGGKTGGGEVYTDYARLLAETRIDLVELLVPHHLHAEMTVLACRRVSTFR